MKQHDDYWNGDNFNTPMINFRLKQLDEVVPAGTNDDLRMSWFWLTDSYLWLELGDSKIYEYTHAAMEEMGLNKPRYNDYPLSRFIEDFSELFELISESVPKEMYELTENLDQFLNDAEKWLDIYENDDIEYSDFYFEEYTDLISWTINRTFNSAHLIGGPHLSFFRHEDSIRIIWDTEHQLDSGTALWTAKDGSIEISYIEFISHVREFQTSIFHKMDEQVGRALKKDWRNIQIDKALLENEHRERKAHF